MIPYRIFVLKFRSQVNPSGMLKPLVFFPHPPHLPYPALNPLALLWQEWSQIQVGFDRGSQVI